MSTLGLNELRSTAETTFCLFVKEWPIGIHVMSATHNRGRPGKTWSLLGCNWEFSVLREGKRDFYIFCLIWPQLNWSRLRSTKLPLHWLFSAQSITRFPLYDHCARRSGFYLWNHVLTHHVLSCLHCGLFSGRTRWLWPGVCFITWLVSRLHRIAFT
jgi:hypothetical protein